MGNNQIIKCRCCTDEIETKEAIYRGFERVESRQGNYFFTCPTCREPRYHAPRGKGLKNVVGAIKVNGCRTGIELEITSIQHSLFLYDNNFMLTYDSSVSGDKAEWVSPIYEGLSPIPKVLETIYKDCSNFIDNSCGTHFHVSNHNNWDAIRQMIGYKGNVYNGLSDSAGLTYKKDILKKFAKIIFLLEKHLVENSEEAEQIWGRNFNGFCKTLNDFTETTCNISTYQGVNAIDVESRLRYFWLNITNFFGGIETIEFRLPKFTSKDQYMDLIKFGHKFYQVLLDNKDYTDEYIGKQVLKAYIKHFDL